MSVWTVNQLARKHPDEIGVLARTGEQLAAAQAEALSSGGRERFASARHEHAAALTGISTRIAPLLRDAGRPPTQATSERALRTLRAASLDADARPKLVAGGLQDDVEPGGFSLLAGLEVPDRPPRRQTRSDSVREELAALKHELKEARQEAREVRRGAATEARAADRAREQANRAGQAAADAQEAARLAEEAVEELQRRIAGLTSSGLGNRPG